MTALDRHLQSHRDAAVTCGTGAGRDNAGLDAECGTTLRADRGDAQSAWRLRGKCCGPQRAHPGLAKVARSRSSGRPGELVPACPPDRGGSARLSRLVECAGLDPR